VEASARATASQKRLTLVAAILGSSVVFIDSTVVNVALPAIEDDLGGGLAGQQWTSNAYLVTLGSLILIGGSLGDIFGERRIFSLGVVGFGVTSLLCTLAPTIEVLVIGRALQGVFGALLTPAALAVIVAAFPEEERGKAVGSWTAWAGIGTVLGPLVGGQLVDAASWRWIFAINLPLVVIDLFLISRAMPVARARPSAARVDFLGAFLCATGLAAATFALIRQPEAGWGDPTVLLPLVGGVALFVAFLLYEARASHPMLPLGLFRRHNFAVGNIETLSMYAGLSLLFFFLVLFLQQVAGYSALEAGTAGLPVTILMFFLSSRFGLLADRYGPRFFMSAGPLVAAGGLVLLTRLGKEVDYATDLLPALIVFGVGLSMTVAPLTATVLAGADESNAGIASGVNNAVARVAGLVGVAAVGAVVAASFGSTLDDRLGERAAAQPALARALDEAKRRPLASSAPPREASPQERATFNRAVDDASIDAFRLGMIISAVLVAGGGLLGLGIQNPRRRVESEHCAGGQLVGTPRDTARHGCLHRRPVAERAGA
jgi:EmrB/QacA subfamily drug resistance transporter